MQATIMGLVMRTVIHHHRNHLSTREAMAKACLMRPNDATMTDEG